MKLETLQEYLHETYGDTVSILDCAWAPLWQWTCGKCHLVFLAKFPHAINKLGQCPGCFNNDLDSIYFGNISNSRLRK